MFKLKSFTQIICLFSTLLATGQKFDFFKVVSSTPALFADGIISDDLGNRDMAISPNGQELMYTLQYKSGTFSTIIYLRKIDGKWSKPEIAPFSGKFNDLEPFYSADGTRVYFSSNRPVSGQDKTKDYDIWYVQRMGQFNWSEPIQMDAPVNSPKNEFYPVITKSGSIYFTREMKDKDEDIVVCTWNGGFFEEAKSMPDAINTTGAEFNAYVDREENFILYTAYKRPGNIGLGDIYISVKKEGVWQPSINLGDKINDKGLTYCPYVSPDKKYFFFTSSRWSPPPFNEKQNLQSLKKKLGSALNGYDNIYIMSADEILQHLY
ncbi:MAG: hypothetical protein ABI761_10935 [Saprospiraceae bacterium]